MTDDIESWADQVEERVNRALVMLTGCCDTVQILCTKTDTTSEGTRCFVKGHGSTYTRIAQAEEWCAILRQHWIDKGLENLNDTED